jgi:hypothetical protein
MVDVCWIAIDKLTPNGRNARAHSRKQIRQIADSIAAFGFVVPILIDDDGANVSGGPQSHPTVKPVALVADAMRDCSRGGDIVLDLFGGSGTTLLAAERVGRRAYPLEIEPRFVDVAIKRWQTFSGEGCHLCPERPELRRICSTRVMASTTGPGGSCDVIDRAFDRTLPSESVNRG